MVRATKVIRGAIVAGIVSVAVASFLRPPERKSAPPSPYGKVPVNEHVTPSGLVAVDPGALFVRVRKSRAKAVVIAAWASWCGSCKEDLPLLVGLKRTFGEAVELMLLSFDDAETQPKAAEMLRALGATGTSYVTDGPIELFKGAINPRWPGMLPATFLFDASGTLHYYWGGPVMENELVPLLRRYLAGEKIDGEASFGLAPGATAR
jgi:thiol-disulfide isomerase/thioredoxin